MNIKDPLNPYTDTRRADGVAKEEWLKKNKAVYKTNYELVMGHSACRITKSLRNARPSEPVRRGGATLNGRAI